MGQPLGHQRVVAFFAGALTASVAVAESVQTTSAGDGKFAHSQKQAQPINPGCSDILPKYDKAKRYKIGQGTLSTVLSAAGLNSSQKAIVQALSDAGLDLEGAKSRDRVYITWDGRGTNKSLKSLVYRPDSLGDYVLTQAQGDGYEAKHQALCMYESRHSASFQVRAAGQTLSKVMQGASISRAGVSALVETFADEANLNSVDVGDAFKVLYTKYSSKDGNVVRFGRFLYAEVDRGGDGHDVSARHYFNGQYYTPQGQEVAVELMSKPLRDQSYMRSSPFMKRRFHPVDGVYRDHNGVDYAAPKGAKIVAAGAGVVTVKGYHKFRGNYIEIAHGNECVSRYFHMHSFADGVTQGDAVKTGDVIGTVGKTGKATGAHLHYAVECHGVYQDPENMSLPTGAELAGEALVAFKAQRAEHLAQYHGQQPDPQSVLDAHQMAYVPQ